jgi:hypothetical protein
LFADQTKINDFKPFGQAMTPSAYLTQLVVLALRRRKKLSPELEASVSKWLGQN